MRHDFWGDNERGLGNRSLVTNPTSSPYRRRRGECALIAIAVGIVLWFYQWTVDTEGGFDPPNENDYYHLLVQGWFQGQTHLKKLPTPELVNLANPYDPAQNGPHRLPDVSFFRGKFYLYFGVGPAVTLLVPYALVTGEEMSIGAAVFVFCAGAFLTAGLLWLAVRRRYFRDSAIWVAPLGLLALGFGTHWLALARRPMMWELPIAAGVFFSMLALAAVYAAIHGRRAVVNLGAAGLCLGLAVAARPPCALAAAMLLPPLWLFWRARARRPAIWWRAMLAAGSALVVCGVGLMVHNYVRFGSAVEFGQHYQLTGMIETEIQHFSPRFVLPNISIYFFQPVHWTWDFPFVSQWTSPSTTPGYFAGEELCGMAVTLPVVWLALALPLCFLNRAPEEKHRLTASLGALTLLFAGMATFLLSFFAAAERYATDFAPALGLIAVCGWLGLERWTQRARWLAVVMPLVIFCTVVMGALLSFDYHQRRFSRNNPEAWRVLADASRTGLEQVGRWTGQFTGPRILKVRFVEKPEGTVETFWRSADADASERMLVEHLGKREIRFGYVRAKAPVRWGRPLTWKPEHTHTVELQVPSLYPPPGGWMREVRADVEYRERSSMMLSFSGAQALSGVTEAWLTDAAVGGRVGDNFSGELRSMKSRLYRDGEIDVGARPIEGPPGGTLRLRLSFPAPIAADGEPLFAAGELYGSDMVYVRGAGDGRVKFVFDHFGAGQNESAAIACDPRQPMVLEISLPSFAPDAFGTAATGDWILRVNGREVLRERRPAYAFMPGSEMIARNPFGTNCSRAFRGWVFESSWSKGAWSPLSKG